MSAFVKAAADALREVPAVNGVIDGDEIIYRWAASTQLQAPFLVHCTLSSCTAPVQRTLSSLL